MVANPDELLACLLDAEHHWWNRSDSIDMD